MTWRWIVAILAALLMLGCGETTVQPFVDGFDAGVDPSVDAGDDDDEDDAGEDDEEDAGEDDDLDGGQQ